MAGWAERWRDVYRYALYMREADGTLRLFMLSQHPCEAFFADDARFVQVDARDGAAAL